MPVATLCGPRMHVVAVRSQSAPSGRGVGLFGAGACAAVATRVRLAIRLVVGSTTYREPYHAPADTIGAPKPVPNNPRRAATQSRVETAHPAPQRGTVKPSSPRPDNRRTSPRGRDR
jgi:hypothetical protein